MGMFRDQLIRVMFERGVTVRKNVVLSNSSTSSSLDVKRSRNITKKPSLPRSPAVRAGFQNRSEGEQKVQKDPWCTQSNGASGAENPQSTAAEAPLRDSDSFP